MSAIKKALQEEYGEPFDKIDDVEELILDQLLPLKQFSEEDKEFLESFTELKFLSMTELGLENLENFPSLHELVMVCSM